MRTQERKRDQREEKDNVNERQSELEGGKKKDAETRQQPGKTARKGTWRLPSGSLPTLHPRCRLSFVSLPAATLHPCSTHLSPDNCLHRQGCHRCGSRSPTQLGCDWCWYCLQVRCGLTGCCVGFPVQSATRSARLIHMYFLLPCQFRLQPQRPAWFGRHYNTQTANSRAMVAWQAMLCG